ncbi:MAG TPA: thioesterase family protein [Candidatus Methanoperedens sp.]|nr:thioesterase family protein [Candidatus Methanoperedens sp.]
MAFVRETTVRLYDTDASGRLFFGARFRLSHEVFEEFRAEIGFALSAVLGEGTPLYPIVRADADFKAPLAVDDRLRITLDVPKIGEHSFTLRFRLALPGGREAATAEQVHVALDATSGKPIPLAATLRKALEPYRST